MIVKNEAHIIAATLAHLMEQFPITHWVIDDTGSTDGTQELITKFFAEKGIPGTLHQTEWRDFGFNRSKALEHAYNLTDYVLVWDADDSVVGRFVLPSPLIADQYSFTFGDAAGFRYSRTQLFNNRKRWCYKGVLHEYPVSAEVTGPPTPVTGNYYFVSGRSGARSRDPEKYKKDAAVLERGLLTEPNNDRYVYYCANSYKDAGEPEKAIAKYKQLLTMNGWSEERYMACIQIYDLSPCEANLHYLVDSYRHSPERVEGIYRLVRHYCIKGQDRVALMYYGLVADHYEKHYDPVTIATKLFVSRDDYDYYLPYYVIICAIRVGNWVLATRMFAMIFRLGSSQAPWWNNNLFHNLQFVVPHLTVSLPFLNSLFAFRDALPYRLETRHEKTIGAIVDRHRDHLTEPISRPLKNKQDVQILLSVTTCKRYDLFRKTMDSMLRTWTDLDAVDYFFCVDDNSAEADRSLMRGSYPFFDFYMKGPAEKGHRASMNIIWAKLAALRPAYWIHLEDDWLFFKSGSYVRDAVAFLERAEPTGIHQVLYNRNYAELYDWDLNGGAPIPGESRFIVHLQSDSIPGRSSGYWPHYSFRPSVIRVAPLLTLGNYDSPNTFFERDYADRWTAAGYRSAFFDDIRCLHIGKLTSDRMGQNAYSLNEESQFCSSSSIPELVITERIQPQIFIVNLKRRADRKTAMEALMTAHGIKDYRFYEAVDGLELQWSPELLRLFADNDFGSRRGVLGCALSHYRLWQQLASSLSAAESQYVILEDDITVLPDFKERLEAVISYAATKPVDILFLGHHCWNEADRDLGGAPEKNPTIPFQAETYVGGTFGYLITKRGAAAYLDYIKENGIRHGIDMLVKKLLPGTAHIEVAAPHIVLSEWDRSSIGKPVDTDIQSDRRSLSLKDGWTFHPGLDSIGGDICHIAKQPVELLMKACLDISGSVAFNTLGFVKSSVALPLVGTPYFGSGDGIYIRDSRVSPIKRIKLLCNWCSSAELCAMVAPILASGAGSGSGPAPIQVTSTTNPADIDYWLILNKPQEGDYYDPARTVVFQLEPWCGESWQAHGAKTWGDWARPDPARFLRVLTAKTGLIPATWQISRVPPPADYVRASRISCILSEKYTDPGQRHRVDFLRFLEAKGGIPLSIFGRENYHGLTSYAGPVPGPKEAAIQPYKYYFMCENNAEPNYVTEKLWDAILCEALCFYWGAPNVADHVNPQAFIQLDMSDYEESYRRIQTALATDAWTSRLPHIQAAKRRLIEEQQMFAVLGRILSS
jgi:GR25 family glycosyltransferase involved in LPS biosynthesis/glycosyltransferase involved in cell wall biosynthesis